MEYASWLTGAVIFVSCKKGMLFGCFYIFLNAHKAYNSDARVRIRRVKAAIVPQRNMASTLYLQAMQPEFSLFSLPLRNNLKYADHAVGLYTWKPNVTTSIT